MTLAEFNVKTFQKDNDYQMKPQIICNDGFIMSVQGSKFHYCSPRVATDKYHSMEIGYPSQDESLIIDYAEDESRLTDTVYGYVPVSIIQQVIEKHGGIDIEKTFQEK